MRESRKQRCCRVCCLPENGPEGNLVDQAAALADEWYESNPMPCGSSAATERYHDACKEHVEQKMTCALGALAMLGIIYYLVTICYTVWHWRREAAEG